MCSGSSSYDDLTLITRTPSRHRMPSPNTSPLRTVPRRCPSPQKTADQGLSLAPPFWLRVSYLVRGLVLVLILVGIASEIVGTEDTAPAYGSAPRRARAGEGLRLGDTRLESMKAAHKAHLRGPMALSVVGGSLGGGMPKFAELATQLKIYIYDLPSKFNSDYIQKDNRVLTHMFAAEILIHLNLLNSSVLTEDPDEADYFFVPVYSTGELNEQGRALPQMAGVRIRQAMNYVITQWPYFNRSHGYDHVVVVPHDFGACFTFREEEALHKKVPMVLRKMTLLQTFGQHNHTCNRVGRSIVIPPYVKVPLVRSVPGLPEDPGQPPRDKFAYFRGLFHDTGNDPLNNKYSRGVREAIWRHFKDHPLFDIAPMVPYNYYEDMRRSLFCLCPLGWAPWSPRVVESIQQGCIPVVISDQIILPFEELLDWKRLVIQVPEKDVPKLDKILTSIPVEEVVAIQKRLWSPEVRRALVYPQPMEEGDAFHFALRELARKLEGTRKKKAKVLAGEEKGHERIKKSKNRHRTADT